MNERWLVEDLILIGLLKVVQQGPTLFGSASIDAAEQLQTATCELIEQAPPNARPKILRRVQATARRCVNPCVSKGTSVATLGLAAFHLLQHLVDEDYVSVGTLSPLSTALDIILPALESAANEKDMVEGRATAICIFGSMQKEGLFRDVVPLG